MKSASIWSTAQAIPTVIDDGPTAIAPRVHRIPTITRRHERHDLAIATIRGALEVLDLHPERRGMASSMQMCVGSTANGLVAGVISPLVMHSTVALATASLVMMGVGLGAWFYIRHRWPEIGRENSAV